MDNTPTYIIINVRAIYSEFKSRCDDLFNNELDIIELFNQAIDYITDSYFCDDEVRSHIKEQLLRSRNLNSNNLEILMIHHQWLCQSLLEQFRILNISPMIDHIDNNEIYPYYFKKLVGGKIILKHF
jgi:hypothetical protein